MWVDRQIGKFVPVNLPEYWSLINTCSENIFGLFAYFWIQQISIKCLKSTEVNLEMRGAICKHFPDTDLKVFHCKLSLHFHPNRTIDRVNYIQVRMREKSYVPTKTHLAVLKCFSLHYGCSELSRNEGHVCATSVFFSFRYFKVNYLKYVISSIQNLNTFCVFWKT